MPDSLVIVLGILVAVVVVAASAFIAYAMLLRVLRERRQR
jgi:hypothetical protein